MGFRAFAAFLIFLKITGQTSMSWGAATMPLWLPLVIGYSIELLGWELTRREDRHLRKKDESK